MKFSYLLIMVLIALHTQAQTVRGMVADQNHEPLIGATVQELARKTAWSPM